MEISSLSFHKIPCLNLGRKEEKIWNKVRKKLLFQCKNCVQTLKYFAQTGTSEIIHLSTLFCVERKKIYFVGSLLRLCALKIEEKERMKA